MYGEIKSYRKTLITKMALIEVVSLSQDMRTVLHKMLVHFHCQFNMPTTNLYLTLNVGIRVHSPKETAQIFLGSLNSKLDFLRTFWRQRRLGWCKLALNGDKFRSFQVLYVMLSPSVNVCVRCVLNEYIVFMLWLEPFTFTNIWETTIQ